MPKRSRKNHSTTRRWTKNLTSCQFGFYLFANFFCGRLKFRYLKEFRVEQCPLFLQHKCTQHRPFTCFHWHFMNQRRRRPKKKRDGTFNYSPDVYCTQYDETTGICPSGDEYVQSFRNFVSCKLDFAEIYAVYVVST